jgi:hypothetical protein
MKPNGIRHYENMRDKIAKKNAGITNVVLLDDVQDTSEEDEE